MATRHAVSALQRGSRNARSGRSTSRSSTTTTSAPQAAAELEVKQKWYVGMGARVVGLAKTSDAHLRVLEERISTAEAHRKVLLERMARPASEHDLETTGEAYRRNTSELLTMYREHKIKVMYRGSFVPRFAPTCYDVMTFHAHLSIIQADSMLFTVLALFGGTIATLGGSALSHWRANHEAERLSDRIEAR